MSGAEVLIRADWDDTSWINVVVRDVVVPLDVVEIHRLCDAVGLVQVFEIAKQIRVVEDASDVALEMSVVDCVEPNECDEQAPVGLHEFRPEEIAARGEACIQLIQCGEQSPGRSFVGLL